MIESPGYVEVVIAFGACVNGIGAREMRSAISEMIRAEGDAGWELDALVDDLRAMAART